MSTAVQTGGITPEIMQSVIIAGDLSGLNATQKVSYYNNFCERVGLDPTTQPFSLLTLKGKQILYCGRPGIQQLNKKHEVSHDIKSRESVGGCFVVTATAKTPDGRHTECIGAVYVEGLKGEDLCNAYMKAETKAKRRATLDLLGLGILDSSEVESMPGAKTVDIGYEEPKGLPEAPAPQAKVVSEPTEQEKVDSFLKKGTKKPAAKTETEAVIHTAPVPSRADILNLISAAADVKALMVIWNDNVGLQSEPEFKAAMNARRVIVTQVKAA